jgi:hypothetical protein
MANSRSSEVNIFSATQIPRMLWNTMVYYIQNSQQLATFLHPVPDKSIP